MSSSTTALLSSHSSSSSSLASSSPASSPAQASWETLRKKSRLLETQMFKKLQQFAIIQTHIMNEGKKGMRGSNAKAGRLDLELGALRATASSPSSSPTAASAANAFSSSLASTSPLLQYETCSTELGDLLRSYADTNEQLQRLLTDHPALNTDSNNYILQKNRTILNDNSLEFKRTQQNIQAALTRAELMSGASAKRSEDALRPRTEALLREEKGLTNSLRLTDEVLEQAVSARDSLLHQGSVFGNVRQKIGRLGHTFPVVAQLMNRINFSKQRDMIVLACVISGCMMFTFYYIMSR